MHLYGLEIDREREKSMKETIFLPFTFPSLWPLLYPLYNNDVIRGQNEMAKSKRNAKLVFFSERHLYYY